LVRRRWRGCAAGLAVFVLTGLLVVSPGPALGQPGPPDRLRERCEAALPQAKIDPIMAKYRGRLTSAREAVMREERALFALLVADSPTRAAVDTQAGKTETARTLYSRVRLDVLWELRSVVPAADREIAFRCAEFLMRRR